MDKNKKRSKTAIAFMLAVVIIAGLVGIKQFTNYLRTRPEISIEETKTACVVYEERLSSYYDELIQAFKTYDDAEKADEWKIFSSTWMVALTNARPVELNKRIPKECSEEKDALVQVNGDMVMLWSEYDNLFNDKKIDTEKVEDLKISIQKTFIE